MIFSNSIMAHWVALNHSHLAEAKRSYL